MRKYWRSIVIIALIVFGVGTYYVNAAVSATQNREFVIKKKSGDEKEIQSVVINGLYNAGPVHEGLQITSDGSRYDSEVSFFDQIKGFQMNKINELQKDYRSFMRGKNGNINSFFEDKQFLVYTDVEYKTDALAPRDFKFKISILDKKKGNTTSLNLPVPENSDFRFISIEDVQMRNNQLIIVTQNQGNNSTEIHVYSFDLSTKKFNGDDTIISLSDQSENTHTEVYMLNETNSMQKHKNIVFGKMEMVTTQQSEQVDVSHAEENSYEFISYNLDTKEKANIQLPKNFKNSVGGRESGTFNGSKVYFAEVNNEGIVITPYSLKDKKVEDEVTLDLSRSTKHGGVPPITTIQKEKIYAATPISSRESKSDLVVADLNTGKTLFEGVISTKNPSQDADEYELYFHQMEIK